MVRGPAKAGPQIYGMAIVVKKKHDHKIKIIHNEVKSNCDVPWPTKNALGMLFNSKDPCNLSGCGNSEIGIEVVDAIASQMDSPRTIVDRIING
jgi:hypothetical protein